MSTVKKSVYNMSGKSYSSLQRYSLESPNDPILTTFPLTTPYFKLKNFTEDDRAYGCSLSRWSHQEKHCQKIFLEKLLKKSREKLWKLTYISLRFYSRQFWRNPARDYGSKQVKLLEEISGGIPVKKT